MNNINIIYNNLKEILLKFLLIFICLKIILNKKIVIIIFLSINFLKGINIKSSNIFL